MVQETETPEVTQGAAEQAQTEVPAEPVVVERPQGRGPRGRGGGGRGRGGGDRGGRGRRDDRRGRGGDDEGGEGLIEELVHIHPLSQTVEGGKRLRFAALVGG